MSALPTTGRLQWTDVPPPLRSRLEHALGASVTAAVTPAGGFGHQLAAALTLDNGRRAFVKAAPTADSLTTANLHEAAILDALPAGAPAPTLLDVLNAAGWTAVVIEHLDGPHPDLSPGSDDPGEIWALLDKLTSDPAPAPRVPAQTWPQREHFIPQKARVRQAIKSPRAAAGMALRLMNPFRWPTLADQLRRHF